MRGLEARRRAGFYYLLTLGFARITKFEVNCESGNVCGCCPPNNDSPFSKEMIYIKKYVIHII